MPSIEILSSLAIIALAGLIHASFQLSISMLTLLSSHTIGKQRSHARLLLLTHSFVFGAGVMTLLLLSAAAFFWKSLAADASSGLYWTVCAGLLFGLGASVWLFYYRKQAGTTLWIPRGMASFLSARAKATKQSAEAFALGLASVIAELLFIFVPITLTALVLITLPTLWQLVGIGLYVVASLSSLLTVHVLIGSGRRISRIQRWREANKGFLQFAAGSGLLALGCYVYVEKVVTTAVMAAAGGV